MIKTKEQIGNVYLTCFSFIKPSSEFERKQSKRQKNLFSVMFVSIFIAQARVTCIETVDISMCM